MKGWNSDSGSGSFFLVFALNSKVIAKWKNFPQQCMQIAFFLLKFYRDVKIIPFLVYLEDGIFKIQHIQPYYMCNSLQ